MMPQAWTLMSSKPVGPGRVGPSLVGSASIHSAMPSGLSSLVGKVPKGSNNKAATLMTYSRSSNSSSLWAVSLAQRHAAQAMLQQLGKPKEKTLMY